MPPACPLSAGPAAEGEAGRRRRRLERFADVAPLLPMTAAKPAQRAGQRRGGGGPKGPAGSPASPVDGWQVRCRGQPRGIRLQRLLLVTKSRRRNGLRDRAHPPPLPRPPWLPTPTILGLSCPLPLPASGRCPGELPVQPAEHSERRGDHRVVRPDGGHWGRPQPRGCLRRGGGSSQPTPQLV